MVITYIVLEDENKVTLGIKNKVNNFLNNVSPDKKTYIVYGAVGKFSTIFAIGKYLLFARNSTIIFRNSFFVLPFLFIFLWIARSNGNTLIVDVYTPISTSIHEILGTKSSILKKCLKVIYIYMMFPVSLYPFHKVIQYSIEGNYFSFGVNGKTKLVGNGISVKDIVFREEKPKFDDTLNFIGVAHLSFWHAYERLIESIAEYKKKSNSIKIVFYIIGEGTQKQMLEELVKKRNLQNQVLFLGQKDSQELNHIFAKMHIGVGSLGLYRIHLNTASILKNREYCARGIPLILSYTDVDIDKDVDFVYRVANNSMLIDIESMVKWYRGLDEKYLSFRHIREFAEKKLDYKVKAKEILE